MKDNIIFFDIGDTLLYRERSHKDFDISLIIKLFKKNDLKVLEAIDSSISKYPNTYIDSLLSFSSYKAEMKYLEKFFKHVFAQLDITENELNSFLEVRQREERYKVFDGMTNHLTDLAKSNELGIISNGRPSRRNTLKNQELDKYFDSEYIFISDEIGLSKPNKEIYEHIESEVRLKNPDINLILVDDDFENVTNAISNGWTAFQFNRNSHNEDLFIKLKNI